MNDFEQKKEKAYQLLIEKAVKDNDFREMLLDAPKATIASQLGVKIPDSIKFTVLEETSDTFYLVLPAKTNPEKQDELSEKELEMVSGGTLGEIYSEDCFPY